MTKEEFENEVANLPRRGDSGPLHTPASDLQRLSDRVVDRASRWMQQQEPHPMHFDAADLRDALPDAFTLRAGLPVHNPHPMAQWASELSLPRLAEQFKIRSLTSSDFGGILAYGSREIISASYSQEDDCSAVFSDRVVKNFQPVAFPSVDMLDLQTVVAKESGLGDIVLQPLTASAGVSPERVIPYYARVQVGREVLINDDWGIIQALVQHLGSSAARLPAQKLGELLATNGNLADGQPLCGSGNTTSLAGFSTATLAEGASKLRLAMSAAGNILNSRVAVWLCRPEGEYLAKATVQLVGNAIAVVVNPWLPSGFSYLVAPPEQTPVFVRLLLSAPLRPALSSGPLPIQFDATYLHCDFAFGLSAVSRSGLVRIPTS